MTTSTISPTMSSMTTSTISPTMSSMTTSTISPTMSSPTTSFPIMSSQQTTISQAQLRATTASTLETTTEKQPKTSTMVLQCNLGSRLLCTEANGILEYS